MSILDRLNLLVRSEFGARSADRPSSREVRATLREASDSLVEVRRIERQLDREHQNLVAAVDREEASAVRALESGDEESARRSLERKAVLARDAATVRADLDDARERLGQLRSALRSLQDRAGISNGSARTRVPAADFDGGPAFDRFSEIEERLAQIEATTEAELGLSDPLYDAREAEMDAEFRRLGARKELEDLRNDDDMSGSALDRLRRMMNEDS